MPALPTPRAARAQPVRRGLRRGLAAATLFASLAPATAAHAATPPAEAAPGQITLHYQERPPYSHTSPDGQVHGLLANIAARACQKAQQPFTWARTPGQRQLVLIQSGQGWDCGLGWYRNAERETLGRFTRAIYQDRPWTALTRRHIAWDPQRSLATLLADPALPLLVKDGYSYGPQLDALIAQHGSVVRRTTAESQQMARMVEAGRAGWMIIAPEEAEALLADAADGNPPPPQLQQQPLPNVPPGQTRHLYCNKAVPEAVIDRLNRALAER